MKRLANLKKGIICYAAGGSVSLICATVIAVFVLLNRKYDAALCMPVFTLPAPQMFALWIAYGILFAYIMGKTLSLRQMPLFYALIGANLGAVLWAILFYLNKTFAALIVMLIVSVTQNALCFSLTSKKDARWFILLPCALWLLYLLIFNYAVVLLN